VTEETEAVSQTFHELQEVLRRERFKVKYGFQEKEIEELLETIATGTEFVPAIPIFRLPLHGRDKKDDKFLACALGGDCDYLITEDEDLLVLNGKRELGKLQIVTAYEFLKRTSHV
jgi:putative PIN family toxin of toxin-antitoxin system